MIVTVAVAVAAACLVATTLMYRWHQTLAGSGCHMGLLTQMLRLHINPAYLHAHVPTYFPPLPLCSGQNTQTPPPLYTPEQIASLSPATHAYSFWEGVPLSGKQAFGRLFRSAKSMRVRVG